MFVENRIAVVLAVCFAWMALPNSAFSQSVSVNATVADQAIRYYGTKSAKVSALNAGGVNALAPRVPIVPFAKEPASEFRPKALVIGEPLIEPRGLVKGKGVLYIADSGHDEKHQNPATIWRLDPATKKLDVFFRGDQLINCKWLYYLSGEGGAPDRLVISDYGEEPSFHAQGSGKGAKLFTIDVLPDGSAGPTRVVYEGAPLRSPQGVTVIGNTVILADTGGGEMAHRFDAPEVTYRSGALFAIPLSGGPVTKLFPEHTFVTLVGTCIYYDNGQLYLRMWDIDGGRRDTSSFAWMPHSGFAALYRTKVLSTVPLKLGPLEKVPFIEEFPIDLTLHDLKPGQSLVLKGANSTTFSGGSDRLVLAPQTSNSAHLALVAESPLDQASVDFHATIFSADGSQPFDQDFSIKKNIANPRMPYRDNKHAGARVLNKASTDDSSLDASVDGLSKTVVLFPPRGGVSAVVWQGAPLVTPMASQWSWDGKWLWVTDMAGGSNGTGAVWQLPAPSAAQRATMYSPGNAWRYEGDHLEH